MKKAMFSLLLLVAMGLFQMLHAQGQMSKVAIQTIKVTDNIHMLLGYGGNIGVCTGEDGAFLIDDQFAPLTKKIVAAVKEIHPKEIRFVLNTHLHGDHTGGNENLGKAGAVIVAHKNVRTRMSKEEFVKELGRKQPVAPKIALPIVTFAEEISFHVNGEEIRVFHVANAHTDGDSIVHFKKSNVIHMGDCMFNGLYPFIDSKNGGGIAGNIKACNLILSMVDDKTKIIPGHGPLANKADLVTYRDMLVSAQEAMLSLIKAGKSKEECIAADPLKAFNKTWGRGFMKPKRFVSILFDDLSREK